MVRSGVDSWFVDFGVAARADKAGGEGSPGLDRF